MDTGVAKPGDISQASESHLATAYWEFCAACYTDQNANDPLNVQLATTTQLYSCNPCVQDLDGLCYEKQRIMQFHFLTSSQLVYLHNRSEHTHIRTQLAICNFVHIHAWAKKRRAEALLQQQAKVDMSSCMCSQLPAMSQFHITLCVHGNVMHTQYKQL